MNEFSYLAYFSRTYTIKSPEIRHTCGLNGSIVCKGGETLLDLRVTLREAVLCVTPSLCPCWQKGEV